MESLAIRFITYCKPVLQVAYCLLRVDNFLDPLDGDFLAGILSADPDIYGLTTEFACPVKVSVYYSQNSNLSADKLKRMVEQRDVIGNSKDDKAIINLNFKVTGIEREPKILDRAEYLQKMGI